MLLIFCSLNLIGQTNYEYDYKDRYRFTRIAKRNLKLGNLKRAEKFIKKTKLCSNGSCGTWDLSEIDFLEVQILNKQRKFNESLQCLDSLIYNWHYAEIDSLKIVTLFLKFGKDKIKNAFKKIDKYNGPELRYALTYWVFLDDLNYKFWFTIPDDYRINNEKKEKIKTGNEFYDLVKDQPFYKLLQ